jgi:hypothetical protein
MERQKMRIQLDHKPEEMFVVHKKELDIEKDGSKLVFKFIMDDKIVNTIEIPITIIANWKIYSKLLR